jgi:hypothetical protein
MSIRPFIVAFRSANERKNATFAGRKATVLRCVCAIFLASLFACTSRADDGPSAPSQATISTDELMFFEEHIRPLLENRCYKCHSATATELHANLYLDSRPGWQKGGDSGPAIHPGKPSESLLVQAIGYSEDAATQMPPEGKLPDREIALLTKWIEMGAQDPRSVAVKHAKQRTIDLESERHHWAYQPLVNTTPPGDEQLVGSDPKWLASAIDRFVMAKLKERTLATNLPADRVRLIRRAHFDLIGLPPSPSQVDAFLIDTAPNAFEKVVDWLLASPHYGERWGRHWLDIARFAESHGFEQDYDRPSAFHYRDFVIRALNDDMPYDQFLKWQLAGDEYAPGDPLALAATGFLAAGVHATQITANQAEKERYDELDDMARTVGTTMLGLTVGCARCHDHKFDPIPNADYYGMVSAFTTTVRSDFDVPMDPDGDKSKLAIFETEHAPLVAKLDMFDRDELDARFDRWRKENQRARHSNWLILEPTVATSSGGATLTKQSDGSFLASGKNPKFDTYQFVARTDLRSITAIRVEALADSSMKKSGPGRASNGNFDLTHVSVVARPVSGTGSPIALVLKNPQATFEQGGNLSVAMAIDEDRKSGWAIDPQFGKDHAAVFDTNEDIGFEGGTEFEFQLEFKGNDQHNFGRTRLSVSTAPRPATIEIGGDLLAIQDAFTAIGEKPIAEANESQRKLLLDWYKPRDELRKALAETVDKHAATKPKPTLVKMLISSEGVPAVRLHTQGPDFYDKTFILKRGDPNQKTTEAEQRFLTVLMKHPDGPKHWLTPPPGDAKTSFRRTALANWITDTEHGAGMLAARVIVNRLWQHHFGTGLVATPSDFGTQGARPSHPELLDYLASELIRNGWKLKNIHKQMMLSATYGQSSKADAARMLADHDNSLLWRYAPRRMEAEIIRDSLLSVSGKLDSKQFGAGTLDMKMHRRSIYFFVKRSQLIPMLSLFDSPDTLQDLALRSNTTVAPQALLMMNSPIVREYAEGLAAKANGVSSDLEAQVRAVYRECLSRTPTAGEVSLAIDFIGQQKSDYTASGKPKGNDLAFVDWCQAILSLNEFVFVD